MLTGRADSSPKADYKVNGAKPKQASGGIRTLRLLEQEAKEFGTFILEKVEHGEVIEEDYTGDRVTDLVLLWVLYCTERGVREKQERIRIYQKERSCYGSFDDTNSLCTKNCRFGLFCGVDSLNGYVRCHYCARPAMPGNNKCPVHQHRNKKSSQLWRDKHREQGNCIVCGSFLKKECKGPCCSNCRERGAIRQRERAKKRIAKGLCPKCGRMKEYRNSKFKWCYKCRKKNRDSRKRRKEAKHEHK